MLSVVVNELRQCLLSDLAPLNAVVRAPRGSAVEAERGEGLGPCEMRGRFSSGQYLFWDFFGYFLGMFFVFVVSYKFLGFRGFPAWSL